MHLASHHREPEQRLADVAVPAPVETPKEDSPDVISVVDDRPGSRTLPPDEEDDSEKKKAKKKK